MTHLYQTHITIVIKVEANNTREANAEAAKIANEIVGNLPVGASSRNAGDNMKKVDMI